MNEATRKRVKKLDDKFLDKTITFRSVERKDVSGKRLFPPLIRLRPAEDGVTGGIVTGQRFETREKDPFIVSAETSISIEDGKSLNLSDAEHKLYWGFIKYFIDVKYIASAKEKAYSNKSMFSFYIENVEEEAKIKITKDRYITNLKSKIYDLSSSQIKELFIVLGNNPENHSDVEIQNYLIELANTDYDKKDSNPTKIGKLLDDEKSFKKMLFVRRLIRDKKIEYREHDQNYAYNQQILGRTVSDVIVNLDNEEYRETKAFLMKSYNDSEKTVKRGRPSKDDE